MRFGAILGSALALVAGASAAAAGRIEGIAVHPSPGIAHAPVEIRVVAHGGPCGARVEFGDGDGRNLVLGGDETLLPRALEHVYTAGAHYPVSVRGARVAGRPACAGRAHVRLTVRDAAAGRARAGGCPAGWSTVRRETDGSFFCRSDAPQAQAFPCPSRFAFWRSGRVAGCSPSRP